MYTYAYTHTLSWHISKLLRVRCTCTWVYTCTHSYSYACACACAYSSSYSYLNLNSHAHSARLQAAREPAVLIPILTRVLILINTLGFILTRLLTYVLRLQHVFKLLESHADDQWADRNMATHLVQVQLSNSCFQTYTHTFTRS